MYINEERERENNEIERKWEWEKQQILEVTEGVGSYKPAAISVMGGVCHLDISNIPARWTSIASNIKPTPPANNHYHTPPLTTNTIVTTTTTTISDVWKKAKSLIDTNKKLNYFLRSIYILWRMAKHSGRIVQGSTNNFDQVDFYRWDDGEKLFYWSTHKARCIVPCPKLTRTFQWKTK